MKTFLQLLWIATCLSTLTSACAPSQAAPTLVPSSPMPLPQATATIPSTEMAEWTPVPLALVPNFEHVVIIIFDKKGYETVIGNPKLPYFNLFAGTFTLLTQYHAVTHASLPNGLALIGGDTFGITDDCELIPCSVDSQSLPDLIEASGRTWKTYQDDMPAPCYKDQTVRYVKRRNPFIFFQPLVSDELRCIDHIVPLTELDEDIENGTMPNFMYIVPDVCYSSHDCEIELSDGWMKDQVQRLYPIFEAEEKPFLIVLTWDEGTGNATCCGLPEKAGGHVATILISPQVKSAFQDNTPYSHYSLLKTIAEAWGLPKLGHAADEATNLITAPWK